MYLQPYFVNLNKINTNLFKNSGLFLCFSLYLLLYKEFLLPLALLHFLHQLLKPQLATLSLQKQVKSSICLHLVQAFIVPLASNSTFFIVNLFLVLFQCPSDGRLGL